MPDIPIYTQAKMDAALTRARADALEDAAKVAEGYFAAHDKRLITAVHIADAIRSLAKPEGEKDE